MNTTAKEGVKRGKRRDRKAHQKRMRVAPEGMTSDSISSVASNVPSRSIKKSSNNIREKMTVNGRLPPLVPPVKVFPLKDDDIELHDHENTRKRPIGSEEAKLRRPSLLESNPPNHSPSPGTKRRNGNMTSYEKMLQRQKGRKTSLGAYAILHSAREDELDSVRGETNTTGSKASLPSDSSVNRSRPELNQTLLQYFAKLSSSVDPDDSVDLDHIQSLINEGASVNTSDRFGQTLLHEVSRTWGVGVAQFLIDRGADVNKSDDFGRTPLHVAASADYSEMVRFLIEKGANVHARTAGEDQTPLYYAAKNEAVKCVQMLLAFGADIEVRDYKLRTPLQVAAEHKSAEVTRLLLDEGASAGVKDDSGMSALSLLISQMLVVAYRALDQFHSVDRIHRKQNFYLNFLETCDCPKEIITPVPSPLQAVSLSNCLELVMHPIFQRLIDVKWRYFRVEAWLDIFPNFVLAILYTVFACSMPQDVSAFYTPLSQQWWKIVIEIVFALIMLNEIRKEVKEYYRSKKQSRKLIKWRRKEVERDLAFCHPRWPQEKAFVEQELRMIKLDKSNKQTYLSDPWNLFDWLTYAMMMVVIALHFVTVNIRNEDYNRVFVGILSCSVIPVWVRLLKYARPFPGQGPFVVMLGHIINDTAKWLFVILVFYIPYGAALWIVFGPRAQTPIQGYDTILSLLYSILQIPLLDSYNFAELSKAAPYMSRVLCGSFIIIAAIVLMNLYIALLSNTFQRVYDNALATAALQRARFLQDLELDASIKKVKQYRDFISKNCSPQEADYIALLSEEEEQTRKQEEKVSEIHNIVSKRLGGKRFGKLEKSEFDDVLENLESLTRSHLELKRLLCSLTSNVEELRKTTSFLYEEHMHENQDVTRNEQKEMLERLTFAVQRLEEIYSIDNDRNLEQPLRSHKANQT